MRALALLLIAACGGAPQTPTPTQTQTRTQTQTHTQTRTQTQTQTHTQTHKQAYASATEAAARSDFREAIRLLEPFEHDARPDDKLSYWIHNEQTWLYWATSDLATALAQTNLGSVALDKSTLPADDIASMRLHALWDRAYLLLDLDRGPEADAARTEYEALARPRNDHDGMAVLAAFFAAKRKNGKDALAAARKVDVEKDEDLQDLYVLALAFDVGGDHTGARSIRERICRGNAYLMKWIIIARMTREGFQCPRRE